MKLLSGFSLILIVSLALSGCDHGYTSRAFSSSTLVFDCSSTATNNGTTSCVPAGSGGGGTTPTDPTNGASQITTDNYVVLAEKVSAQIDRLVRHRSGNPPPLTELALLLLQRIQDDTVVVCTNNPNYITISETTGGATAGTNYRVDFDSNDGCDIDGIPTRGSLDISGFDPNAVGGPLTGNGTWNTAANISIGSLSFEVSPDLTEVFVGDFGITITNDTATITTQLTMTNLILAETNTGASTSDTFTTGTLISADDTNNLGINIFNTTINNTSVTQSTLNVTSSANPSPLTWDKNSTSDNPFQGSLFVTASDNSSTLSLIANDANTMTVLLNNSESSCATWANINPGACP